MHVIDSDWPHLQNLCDVNNGLRSILISCTIEQSTSLFQQHFIIISSECMTSVDKRLCWTYKRTMFETNVQSANFQLKYAREGMFDYISNHHNLDCVRVCVFNEFCIWIKTMVIRLQEIFSEHLPHSKQQTEAKYSRTIGIQWNSLFVPQN